MELKLTTKPKSPTIIEGFPGLGLIGTIVTEYLIKHLGAKSIGYIKCDKIPPMVAIHESKIIQPLEVFYAKSKNLVILHALTDVKGTEWEISEGLAELCKVLKAKEVVSIEGILGQGQEINLYYYSQDPKAQIKFNKAKATGLKEGIVTGVTAAMLLKSKELNFTGIFAETHSKLPDSRAAAKIIEMLDSYLGLGVDYKPLEAAAAEFEKQIKGYAEKMQKTAEKTDDKCVNYFG